MYGRETKNPPKSENVLFSIAYVNEFLYKPLYFYANLLFKLNIADLFFLPIFTL